MDSAVLDVSENNAMPQKKIAMPQKSGGDKAKKWM
jgi:hypothetical protein